MLDFTIGEIKLFENEKFFSEVETRIQEIYEDRLAISHFFTSSY